MELIVIWNMKTTLKTFSDKLFNESVQMSRRLYIHRDAYGPCGVHIEDIHHYSKLLCIHEVEISC